MKEAVTVWINPSCSKCRGIREILEERGVSADYRLYLEDPPQRAELDSLLQALGTDDPRALLRSKEPLAAKLGLEDAAPEVILDAIVAHPELLQRPILVVGGRAVVARPLEKGLPLLEGVGA